MSACHRQVVGEEEEAHGVVVLSKGFIDATEGETKQRVVDSPLEPSPQSLETYISSR